MKPILTFFCLINLCFGALAPTKPGQLSGRVLDEQQKPVECATVALFAATTDSALGKATYTDDKGGLAFASLAGGVCRLKISFVGFRDIASPALTITAGQSALDAGMLVMPGQAKQLAEVVVTGQKALIEQKIDRMVPNVGAVDAFDDTALAMVKMIADELITSHIRLFLNGIISDEYGIFLSNLTDKWLDHLPKLAGAPVFLVETTGDGIMG